MDIVAEYKFNVDTITRKDCSNSADAVGVIKAGETLSVTEVAGGWYNTSRGWAYGFSGSSPIVENVTVSDDILKVGASVVFSADSNVTDANGTAIPADIAKTPFTIDQINTSDKIVHITNGENTYWVSQDTLTSNVNGVVNVPADIAQQEQVNQNQLTSYNTDSIIQQYEDQASGNQAQGWLTQYRIKDNRGIFGMPYQYMEIADPRITTDADAFGATYAQKIVSKLPMLVMVPGTPEFLDGYDKKTKEGVVKWIMDTTSEVFNGGDNGKSDLDNLIQNPGKYYGLKQDWKSYFMHVNPMCRAAAQLLGLQDYVYYGKALGHYDWQDNANDKIKSVLNYKGGSAFYINAETQINESFSNSSTQSMIAGKINGISDLGREMNFLLGGASANTGVAFDALTKDGQVANNEKNKQSMAAKIVGQHNVMEGITSGLKTVIAGGKLIFPEIWSDSQFSRDYDVNVKLVSPDCDLFSLYLNIIVPLLHLIGFVAPRSTGPTGYVSPFLVRAFYKGMFNVDMGIITNMSFQKGAEGSWSIYGIPTVVDVHFTIKELYGVMTITSNSDLKKGLLRNLGLMDYIGNLCGININEPDWQRTVAFYYSQFVYDKFADMVYTGGITAVDQYFTNKVLRLWGNK